MLIGDLPAATLTRRLRNGGVHLDTGAFTTEVWISLPHLAGEFGAMYSLYPMVDPPGIDDARVRITYTSRLRRYVDRQARAWADDMEFEPVPAERAFPLLESALNWAVAASDVSPLVIHSAVLERDGRALIMPAPSGSGKSTLCAALAWRGWRLFSDEMAVFSLRDGSLRANPRPVSLKNEAIDLIAAFEPKACFGPRYPETRKGTVAFMQAPPDAVARAHEPAQAALVIAPFYRKGKAAALRRLERVEGFRWLTDNSVNYASLLGTGFEMLTGVVARCGLYALTYSKLDDAIAAIDQLHRELPPAGTAR